jgi:hypothetical protein
VGTNYGVPSRLKAALHFKILSYTVQFYLHKNYCKIHWSEEVNSSTIRFFINMILNLKKIRAPKESLDLFFKGGFLSKCIIREGYTYFCLDLISGVEFTGLSLDDSI